MISLTCVGLCVAAAGVGRAAETVHLTLTADGVALQCDSTQIGLERDNTIQAFSFGSSLFAPIDTRTGLPSGRHQHRPIRITKAVDRCTPLLIKALTNRETVAGSIRFYRPSPSGDGSTEQFLTIGIGGGRIFSHSIVSPDTTNPETAQLKPLEHVGIVFQTITWTFEPNGTTHTDSVETPAAQ